MADAGGEAMARAATRHMRNVDLSWVFRPSHTLDLIGRPTGAWLGLLDVTDGRNGVTTPHTAVRVGAWIFARHPLAADGMPLALADVQRHAAAGTPLRWHIVAYGGADLLDLRAIPVERGGMPWPEFVATVLASYYPTLRPDFFRCRERRDAVRVAADMFKAAGGVKVHPEPLPPGEAALAEGARRGQGYLEGGRRPAAAAPAPSPSPNTA